jgi:hypothetical protein
MFTDLYLHTKIGSKWYIVTSNFIVKIEGETYVIPFGFKTDFATIPRIFWILAASDDADTREASVLHDFLYSVECLDGVSRAKADKLFLIAMKELKASLVKRHLIYLAVRMFGWLYYKK